MPGVRTPVRLAKGCVFLSSSLHRRIVWYGKESLVIHVLLPHWGAALPEILFYDFIPAHSRPIGFFRLYSSFLLTSPNFVSSITKLIIVLLRTRD